MRFVAPSLAVFFFLALAPFQAKACPIEETFLYLSAKEGELEEIEFSRKTNLVSAPEKLAGGIVGVNENGSYHVKLPDGSIENGIEAYCFVE